MLPKCEANQFLCRVRRLRRTENDGGFCYRKREIGNKRLTARTIDDRPYGNALFPQPTWCVIQRPSAGGASSSRKPIHYMLPKCEANQFLCRVRRLRRTENDGGFCYRKREIGNKRLTARTIDDRPYGNVLFPQPTWCVIQRPAAGAASRSPTNLRQRPTAGGASSSRKPIHYMLPKCEANQFFCRVRRLRRTENDGCIRYRKREIGNKRLTARTIDDRPYDNALFPQPTWCVIQRPAAGAAQWRLANRG